MSRIKRLIQSYSSYIAVPWRNDAAAAQRVIFCIYNENDERRPRARIDEFELVTRQAGHDWALFDLTDTFAQWLAAQRYATSYFQKPHLLPTLLPKYLAFITDGFSQFLQRHDIGADAVGTLQGAGSLAASGKFESARLCAAKRVSPSCDVEVFVYFCSLLLWRLLVCGPSNCTLPMMPYPP